MFDWGTFLLGIGAVLKGLADLITDLKPKEEKDKKKED